MRRIVGVAIALTVTSGCARSVPAAEGPADASRQSFIVGFAFRNETGGHIEPVARFTGTEWTNTWPAAAAMSVPAPALDRIPDAWLGRPVPREWTLWSTTGAPNRARVIGTRRGDSCEALIQLVIENATALTADEAHLALDTSVRPVAIRPIDRRDRDWSALEPVVLAAFRAHEPQAFESDVVLRRRISPAQMANRPIAIEYLVRPVESSGPTYAYFEAARRIEGSTDGVAVSGWLRQDSGNRWTAVNVSGRGLGGDGSPLPERRPLAMLRVADRHYWIVELRFYEGTAAAVIELTPAGVMEVLTVSRGGC